MRRCARLLEEGVAPSSILVTVASGFAAQAFKRRLRQALGEERGRAAEGVAVLTALEACVSVLDAPEARAFTGRTPRLLNGAEYLFFLEDMKALGFAPRVLRASLENLYERMAGLNALDEQLDDEEAAVLAHLRRALSLRGAMLAQEAPALCAAFLKSDAGASSRNRYDHVLCDDYQNLTRAERACLDALAGRQIIVACDNIDPFEPEHPDTKTFELTRTFGDPTVAAFAGAPHEPTCAAPADGSVAVVKWSTPEEEVDGIAKLVRAAVEAESDARESRTCVAVPDKRWALMMEQALKRRGFAVSAAGAASGLGGDPRESSRAKALVAYTKLNLLADPSDLVAWRSWCGLDHPALNSGAWLALQNHAEGRGIGLLEALEQAAACEEEPFPQAAALAERWKSGQDFIARNGGRRGFSAMRTVGAEGLPEFAEVERMLEGDEDAAGLFKLMREQTSRPTFPESAHTLHIASFDAMAGTEYDNLFVVAAIDGLTPSRRALEGEAAMDAERRAFRNGVAKAMRKLVISHFAHMPVETAERMKLPFTRVRAVEGERVAVVRPTTFLAEAGDACPGTTGGQALLAELGLA